MGATTVLEIVEREEGSEEWSTIEYMLCVYWCCLSMCFGGVSTILLWRLERWRGHRDGEVSSRVSRMVAISMVVVVMSKVLNAVPA